MKKTSVSIKNEMKYNIEGLVNNIALIKNDKNESALLNIETNELVIDFCRCFTYFDSKLKFFIQEKDDNKNKYLRIYDVLNNKIIIDFEVLHKSYEGYFSLISVKRNGKLYLIDIKNPTYFYYLNKGYDNIERLFSAKEGTYLIITLNNKKALYRSGTGFLTAFEYNNIEKIKNVLIYEKDNVKYFAYENSPKELSEGFQEITTDRYFIYGKKDKTIEVFSNELKIKILSCDCDEIKFVNCSFTSDIKSYYFIVAKNGLKSLKRVNIDYKNKEIINEETLLSGYDEITFDKVYYLKKDGKVLVTDKVEGLKKADTSYDEIIPLQCNYYMYSEGDNCLIKQIKEEDGLVGSKTRTKIINNDVCLFKDGQFGVVHFCENNRYNYTGNKYDDIFFVEGNYFISCKDSKYGIVCKGQEIISPVYEDIDIHSNINKPGLNHNNTIYFSLKLEENKYKLVEFKHDYLFYKSDTLFQDIEFLHDIMILRTEDKCLVYNYLHSMLCQLDKNSQIEEEYDEKNGVKYYIDGVPYFYDNGVLREMLVDKNEKFITAYESEYGIVTINSNNLEEHNLFCETIEDMLDSEFDGILKSIYDENLILQRKYPKLKRKK